MRWHQALDQRNRYEKPDCLNGGRGHAERYGLETAIG
jgi:hypothetical protein